MKRLLGRIWEAVRLSDDLPAQLFAFLGGDAQEFPMLGGKKLSREEVRQLLQELIPAQIETRGVCTLPISVVCAAPHVSFDGWSEYFCNRVAQRYHTGWVVAKNFRDQDPYTIPAPIGRHVHVNRPTESPGPGRMETETERAREIHAQYLAALAEGSGKGKLPLDLLIEFHSHHRTPYLEIATAGVERELAEKLCDDYTITRSKLPILPEIQIEPLHTVRMTADGTKQFGSMRPEVARRALHIEVPRSSRRDDLGRRALCKALFVLTDSLLKKLITA
jgi:hypothetical protein